MSPGVRLPPRNPASLRLSELALHQSAVVQCVDTTPGAVPAERARQLAEIGFVPGERVSVVARAWPGGDPMVVRVGHSRFALRQAEAACVWVDASDPAPPQP